MVTSLKSLNSASPIVVEPMLLKGRVCVIISPPLIFAAWALLIGMRRVVSASAVNVDLLDIL
ncbi:hypothetical protein EV14_0245 [Prochlorococcus sp. MIT 0703]|nr:hypothetical protein EV14_0245 [Prochlorococcus sp. MIT 0703]